MKLRINEVLHQVCPHLLFELLWCRWLGLENILLNYPSPERTSGGPRWKVSLRYGLSDQGLPLLRRGHDASINSVPKQSRWRCAIALKLQRCPFRFLERQLKLASYGLLFLAINLGHCLLGYLWEFDATWVVLVERGPVSHLVQDNSLDTTIARAKRRVVIRSFLWR